MARQRQPSAADLAAELERRAAPEIVKVPRKASASSIVALIAALGGPAVLVPLALGVLESIDRRAAAAEVRAADARKRELDLITAVAEARAACGRAELTASDAKSQAAAAVAIANSAAKR